MKDKVLRQNIIDELDFEPSISAAKIGVAVADGVVTLTGEVPNYAQKMLAEKAVQRVRGVRGFAEDLQVEADPANIYSDDDVARRALTVIDLNVLVPAGKVQIKVDHGWLTLSGGVEWDYQRSAAVEDLRKLRGVMGITNNIAVKPHAGVADIERRIRDALKRNADCVSEGVSVSVQDGRVRLEGHVDSWADRSVLERAAWSAPGVELVEDHVSIA